MSKAKRILSILLAMVLMITSVPALPVEAAENGETTTITVESIGAKPGSLVDVDVTIENNPGILGAVLKLTYDKALTLVNVTEGEAFSPGRYPDSSPWESRSQGPWTYPGDTPRPG